MVDSSGEGRRGGKAVQLAESGCVKKYVFSPSGRELWTVVGSRGDLLVDDALPYCSCRHFHFRVIGGMDVTCVHLMALTVARARGLYKEFKLSDEEYRQLLGFILNDFSSSL
ncbi:MAG: hypothetical protein HYU39_10110 [Thaumarchaeota archaeon]|nr:hypothetical protein [Nitrososphaerota archaeon]